MAVLALFVTAVALWLPGAALLRRLHPAADGLVVLATAPVLSFGVLWAWADVVFLVGVRVSWLSVLLPVVVLAAALLLLDRVRRRRESPATVQGRVEPLGTARWVALSVVSGVAFVAWWVATEALSLVPPGTDGQHHGLMAQRILELGTLDAGRLFVPDVLLGGSGADFYYPLGLHAVAAVVASVTGAPVAVTLNALVVLACAVVLPAGLALLTRRLFPGHGWALVVAGLASVSFPAFPYFLGHWGMYPLLVAMAFVAPTLDLLLAAVDDLRPVAGGALLALAVIGLFSLHGSELVLFVLLGVLLLCGDLVRRGWGHARTVALRLAVAVPVVVVAALPRLGAISGVSGASGTLAEVDVLPSMSLGQALLLGRTFFLGPLFYLGDLADDYVGPRSDAQVLLSLLGALCLAGVVLVGAVVTVRRRARPEWLIGWAVIAALGLWAGMRLPGVEALTWPWFSQWYRIGPAELLFLAPYLGVGAVVLAARLAPHRAPLVAGLVALGLVVVPLLPQLVDSRAMLAYDFREMSLADPGARAAWEFLRENEQPGDRVLNEHVDGSGWMYAVAGVAPLFPVNSDSYPADDERVYLARHAADLLTDPRAARAADDWQVGWAYVGPRTFPNRDLTLDAAALAGSSAWRLVFEQDGARVYQRVDG